MAAQGVFRWMQAYVVMLYCFTEALSAASESSRSYYDTLSVEPSASDSHIKKAFRKLAIKYHPDKNKSADAEKTFGEIAEAYKVLSNKEKRKLYDFMGHEAFLNEASVGQDDEHETSFHFGFEDLFHDFDDSPFVEEPFFHWTFAQDGEDDNGLFNHYGVEEHGHSFYFLDEEEDDHDYYV